MEKLNSVCVTNANILLLTCCDMQSAHLVAGLFSFCCMIACASRKAKKPINQCFTTAITFSQWRCKLKPNAYLQQITLYSKEILLNNCGP